MLGTCQAEEAAWRFEKQRLEQAVCDGDYRSALELSKTFQKEFQRAKSSYKGKYNWMEHEAVTIDAHLTIGMVNRMCGNYGVAQQKFELALNELGQLYRRNLRKFAVVAPIAASARQEATYAAARAEDAAAEGRGAAVARLAAAAAAANADAWEATLESVNPRVAELLAIQTYDSLGSLSLDASLPLSRDSLKPLRDAEKFFRKAQEVREGSRFGAAEGASIHGSQQITFLLNYGNVFVKRARLKMIWPDCPPKEESAASLLDRAADYFENAEDVYSKNRRWLEDFKTVVGDGTVADAEKAVVDASVEASPTISRDQHKRNVKRSFLERQQMVLGGADLDFKLAELKLAKTVLDSTEGVINKDDRARCFEEAEGYLRRATDAIELVGPNRDHPYLIICFAELVSLEATRAKFESRKPLDEYGDYLTQARSLVQKHDLPETAVQSQYLNMAQSLWDDANL
jgi:hypothetical protein